MAPPVLLRRRNGGCEVVARLEDSGSYNVTVVLESVDKSDVSKLSRDEAIALFAEVPSIARAVERVSRSNVRVEIVGARVAVRSDATPPDIAADFSDITGGRDLVAAALSSSARKRRTAEAEAAAMWVRAVALREAIAAEAIAGSTAATCVLEQSGAAVYSIGGGDGYSSSSSSDSSSSSSSGDDGATAVPSPYEQRSPLARPGAALLRSSSTNARRVGSSSTLVRVGRRATSTSPPLTRRMSFEFSPRTRTTPRRRSRLSPRTTADGPPTPRRRSRTFAAPSRAPQSADFRDSAPPLPPRVVVARLISPLPPGAETPSSRGGALFAMTPISTLLYEGEVMHGDDDQLI